MRKALLCFALMACSKAATDTTASKPAAEPPAGAAATTADHKAAPPVQEGETATMFDPTKLPAPGTAPAPVTVSKELDGMWSVPLKTLQGKDAKLADYKGKALMIVNVASKCGNTPQYATLEALQKKYEPKGFTVLGFPCNQFGGQEPGTSKDIETFCAVNYGITFPIFQKIDVNGADKSEIYKELEPIKDAGGHDGDIRWNFEKFVVSADGTKVTRFSPKTQPDDPAVIAAVENALPTK
jgi:glutathione peroxidase